jgi:hypothetical protein
MDGYTGPDADGTEANGKPDQGEPNFGVTDNVESDQVGLTSFFLRDVDDTMGNEKRYWDMEIKPGVFYVRAGFQRDIAWSYGSGYIKLLTGEQNSQFYAIACLFGNNKDDILRNKKTMQVIYDNNYNFSKPPRKPTISATAGKSMVLLQWDDRAESSNDPIYGQDFEAYYIYKSTDPTFSDIKTISDAFGNPFLFKPLAIFDLKDGLKGINPVAIGSEIGPESSLGVSYNMGNDSGLQHYYIDKDVTNGRTYYYAVVSVDKGYEPDFYTLGYSKKEGLQPISPTTCSANIQVDILGRPIATDQNTVIVTPMEEPAGWVEPKVSDAGIQHVSGLGTGKINVQVVSPNNVKNGHKYRLQFGDDGSYDAAFGKNYTGKTNLVSISDKNLGAVIGGVADPDNNDRAKEFLIEGFKINIYNDTTFFDSSSASWANGSSNLMPVSTTDKYFGTAVPRNYEIRIMDAGADTSVNAIATGFQVWDVSNPDSTFRVKFRYIEGSSSGTRGMLKEGDRIQFVSDSNYAKRMWIFDFAYASSINKVAPQKGNILRIVPRKAFNRNDAFEFTMEGNSINAAKENKDMSNIYTVPDPYIAVSSLERKVINQDEGRGDRRIDFVNLPSSCTISIFTTSGKLVRKLTHYSTANASRESWDLRTKDGLEITAGIYFYVVEAKGMENKIGRLAVIK